LAVFWTSAGKIDSAVIGMGVTIGSITLYPVLDDPFSGVLPLEVGPAALPFSLFSIGHSITIYFSLAFFQTELA
jgi:hypothetical protein